MPTRKFLTKNPTDISAKLLDSSVFSSFAILAPKPKGKGGAAGAAAWGSCLAGLNFDMWAPMVVCGCSWILNLKLQNRELSDAFGPTTFNPSICLEMWL